MAYARYGPNCHWYVFWDSHESGTEKADQILVVWHGKHRAEKVGTQFTYDEVNDMLKSRDLSSIAGFAPEYAEDLQHWLQEFARDVEAQWDAG